MIQQLKDLIKLTPIYPLYKNWDRHNRDVAKMKEWQANGKPVPPPFLVKRNILLHYARDYNLKILVETGTYYGGMIDSVKDKFQKIYSIELSKDLYDKAVVRFKNIPKIELLHGDSGVELSRVMRNIHQPALFWLDAHYSMGNTAKGEIDTPILQELEQIFKQTYTGHVILIDDARNFGTDPAYLSLDVLEEFIKSKQDGLEIMVEDDCIRITPQKKEL